MSDEPTGGTSDDGPTWRALFERAGAYGASPSDVRAALAARRDDA